MAVGMSAYRTKEINLATVTSLLSAPQILVFYPSRSLAGQLQAWLEQCGGRQTQASFERSLAGIRRQIRNADFVLIDATDDPALASDAFFQIYKTLGPRAMTMYTDIVHEGLEMLVRRLGVTMLLGPMSVLEWDDLFLHKFPQTIPLSSAQGAAPSPPPEQEARDEKPVEQPYPIKSIAG
jgi:hypothetical protein